MTLARGLVFVLVLLVASPAGATTLSPFIDLQEAGLSVTSDGAGLANWTSPVSLDVNVGGAVRFALLYWSGVDTACPQAAGVCTIAQPYGDQQVVFNGTALTGTLIGNESEDAAQINHIGYFADVTSLVSAAGPGAHSFAFADGNGSNNLDARSGVTLIVAYTDASVPAFFRLLVWDGLDFGDDDASGANKVMTSITFNHGTATGARTATLLLAAGEATAAAPDQVTISNNATINNSLDASSGAAWDHDVHSINIPAGVASTTVGLASIPPSPADSIAWEVAVLRLPVSSDVTPPTCSVTTNAGPPEQFITSVQDTDSGLAEILVTVSSNADTVVPPFVVGTTGTVTVTSTKIDQTQPATVEMRVTDVAGNTAICTAGDLVELMVTKTDGVTTAEPGTTVNYTITVTNSGTGTASGVAFSDMLPFPHTNLTAIVPPGGSAGPFSASHDPLTGTLTIPAGASVTLIAEMPIPSSATGTLSNTASVTAPSGGGDDPANNSATDVDTLTPRAELSIAKIGPPTVVAGANLTYSISVTNSGPSDATSVNVTDAVPAGTTFVSATSTASPALSCSQAANVVSCAVSALPAGATASFDLIVQVATAAATGAVITNSATVSSATAQTNTANDTASTTATVQGSADLSITKSVTPTVVPPGGALAYTLVVTNNGPGAATSVVVTDPLPTGITATSVTSTVGTCSGTTTVTCNVGTLATGASATITINALVAADASGTRTNTATAASAESDATTANNEASVAVNVNAAQVPLTSPMGTALLAMLLALAGWTLMHKT